VKGHYRNAGLVETLRPTSHIVEGRWKNRPHHYLIEERGDAGAGRGCVETVNNERAFVVGGDALGNDAGVVIEEGGGIIAEVTGGPEEVTVFVAETDPVVLVIEAETANVGDEPGVVDAEEDCIDEVSSSMVGFEDVDLVIVHIWGMARNGGGSPQGLCEDGGFGAHGAASENNWFIGVGEECIPGCFN